MKSSLCMGNRYYQGMYCVWSVIATKPRTEQQIQNTHKKVSKITAISKRNLLIVNFLLTNFLTAGVSYKLKYTLNFSHLCVQGNADF